MTFADKLKEWNDGIEEGSQAAFAKAVGVSPITVSRWVRGENPVQEKMRRRVAKELKITVEELMGILPKRKKYFDATTNYDIVRELREIKDRLKALEENHEKKSDWPSRA